MPTQPVVVAPGPPHMFQVKSLGLGASSFADVATAFGFQRPPVKQVNLYEKRSFDGQKAGLLNTGWVKVADLSLWGS